MISHQWKFVASLLLVCVAACHSPVAPITPSDPAAPFLGRWERVDQGLPPVALVVRREGDALVGQVWLSGVTYTLPATFDDTSVVLANPAASTRAPFVGVLTLSWKMRATLTGQPDVVVTLQKMALL